MMRRYKVVLARQVHKDLKRLHRSDPKLYSQILGAIESLGINPRPDGVKKLTGREEYRMRVRTWRVLYSIHDNVVTVRITRVAPRGAVYDV
ncbi:type II toxin-antitoxin system RelE family toxin [Corynebacterium sp. 22KM0430]|uniref:type II toxin-antitoxin system RelE family toxin n=1 Tax=unclassified Corynebacterium TaxID=2624378 RepID=UPI0039B00B70